MAGARHFSQLVCWQLADALRIETFKITSRSPFKNDFKRRAQIEDAIDSVCRNISEGFGCQSHAEFARYLEISRRSLNELMDCLRSAELKGYVSRLEIAEIQLLSRRLYPALGRLIGYLRRTPRDRRRDGTDER